MSVGKVYIFNGFQGVKTIKNVENKKGMFLMVLNTDVPWFYGISDMKNEKGWEGRTLKHRQTSTDQRQRLKRNEEKRKRSE